MSWLTIGIKHSQVQVSHESNVQIQISYESKHCFPKPVRCSGLLMIPATERKYRKINGDWPHGLWSPIHILKARAWPWNSGSVWVLLPIPSDHLNPRKTSIRTFEKFQKFIEVISPHLSHKSPTFCLIQLELKFQQEATIPHNLPTKSKTINKVTLS